MIYRVILTKRFTRLRAELGGAPFGISFGCIQAGENGVVMYRSGNVLAGISGCLHGSLCSASRGGRGRRD